MEYIVGTALAFLVIGTTAYAGLARERSFFPTVVIVVASYYILFAAMAAPGQTLLLESLAAAVFVAAAFIGFRASPWIIVAALVGHGLFDGVHHRVIANPGVPAWWPGFCMTFDVAAGGLLASFLLIRRGFPIAARGPHRHPG